MSSVTTTIMEASKSTSSVSKNFDFREFSKPTESMYKKNDLGSSFEGPKSPPEIEANEALMDQLKNDFQDILHLQVKGVDPSSTTESSYSFSLGLSESSYAGYHGPSVEEVRALRSIAEKMSAKGRLDKLINVYVTERKYFLNAHFRKLWDEKLAVADVQRLDWGVLEQKILRWIRAVHCCFKSIFPPENQLSNHVFKGLGSNTDGESCFLAIVTDYVTELLDFADAFCFCRRSPERLQKILVFYRRFSCFKSGVNCVFESEAASSIRGRVDCVLFRLGEVVRLSLLDFENTLVSELCNYPSPGGAIHSTTEYVVGFVISLVSESKEELTELITSNPSMMSVGDVMISDLEVKEVEVRTPLAAHLLWIIMVLHINLDRKSKCYQEPMLRNLFMLNNVNYIVKQIRGSAVLSEMIGDNYLNKLTDNKNQSMASYVSETWDGLLYCLKYEGLNHRWSIPFGSGVSKKDLKQRFKKFNTQFKEIHQTQMMWEVPDLELRMTLHHLILRKLVPQYTDFLGKFRSHIGGGEHSERYIMYSAEELETKVLGLFSYRSYI